MFLTPNSSVFRNEGTLPGKFVQHLSQTDLLIPEMEEGHGDCDTEARLSRRGQLQAHVFFPLSRKSSNASYSVEILAMLIPEHFDFRELHSSPVITDGLGISNESRLLG